MTKAVEARLRKLEKVGNQEWVPVFCKDEADYEAALSEKIRRGRCADSDRPRCLPYWDERFASQRSAFMAEMEAWLDEGRRPTGPMFGTHEERLRAGFYDGRFRW